MNGPIKVISQKAPDGADGSEGQASFPVNFVSHIINDGSASLFVGFDADPFGGDALELKSGEVWEDIPLPGGVNQIRFRAADGNTVDFRAVGVYRQEFDELRATRRKSESILDQVLQVRDELREKVDSLEQRADRILGRIEGMVS